MNLKKLRAFEFFFPTQICALYQNDRKLFDMTDFVGSTPIDILISQSDHLPKINFKSKQNGNIVPVQGAVFF